MGWLVGQTGKSFFDGWSIVHLAFWIVIGSTIAAFHVPFLVGMLINMAFAYGWEIFERYAEKRWPNVWRHPESKINSWISDPLMCVLGTIIGYIIFFYQ